MQSDQSKSIQKPKDSARDFARVDPAARDAPQWQFDVPSGKTPKRR
jgi:hypothetical protein